MAALLSGSAAAAPPEVFVAVSTVVVYSDNNTPLVANITIILPDGHTTQRLGDTKPPKGMLELQPPAQCARGGLLDVSVPAGPDIETTVACEPKVVVQLRSINTVVALLHQVNVAEQGGDYGTAALAASGAATQLATTPNTGLAHTLAQLHKSSVREKSPVVAVLNNELAARIHPDEQTLRSTATGQLWKSAGNFFDVPVPSQFMPSTSHLVMTSELQTKITDFQVSEDLTPSGQLDAPTLARMAATSRGTAVREPTGTAAPPETFIGAGVPTRAGCPTLIWRMASAPDGAVHGLAYYADLSGLSTVSGTVTPVGQFRLALAATGIGQVPGPVLWRPSGLRPVR